MSVTTIKNLQKITYATEYNVNNTSTAKLKLKTVKQLKQNVHNTKAAGKK